MPKSETTPEFTQAAPPAKRNRRSSLDVELSAFQKMARIIKPLNSEQRERIFTAAKALYAQPAA